MVYLCVSLCVCVFCFVSIITQYELAANQIVSSQSYVLAYRNLQKPSHSFQNHQFAITS